MFTQETTDFIKVIIELYDKNLICEEEARKILTEIFKTIWK